MNLALGSVRADLAVALANSPPQERHWAALVTEYVMAVATIEARNSVWPYDLISLSRRVGELWEGYCSVCWDHSAFPDLEACPAPSFDAIRDAARAKVARLVARSPDAAEVCRTFDLFADLAGDVNLDEDRVFRLGGRVHVVDFKSGFGSNEKGNALRLATVSRAFRIWEPNTRLFLLVRDAGRKGYLERLRGDWEVHVGAEAYEQVRVLTGVDIAAVTRRVVDFGGDLAPEMLEHLGQHPELMSCLKW